MILHDEITCLDSDRDQLRAIKWLEPARLLALAGGILGGDSGIPNHIRAAYQILRCRK
jgi:hypothetical protein